MRSLLAQLAAAQLVALVGLLVIHAVLSTALAPTRYRQTQALRRVGPVLEAAFQDADRARSEALLEAMAATSHRAVELRQGAGPVLRRGPPECDRWDVTPLADGRELRLCSEGFPFRGGRYRLTIFVLAGLLSTALAFGLARRITAPLSRLSRAAHGLESDVDHPLPDPEGPTEVRVLRASLASLLASLRRRMATQRDLLALASHELRSPLARMQVWVGLAQEGIEPDTQLAALEQEIGDLAALVEDVLASSRLDRRVLAPQRVEVSATVRAVDPDVSMVGDAVIRADPTLFARVMGVLIDNAKRYGRPPVEVRVSGGERVEIQVVDAGGGLDAPARPGGAGVGLALAERICSAHGATLQVESSAETGTIVTLRWPT